MKLNPAGLLLALVAALAMAGCAKGSDGASTPAPGTMVIPNTPTSTTPTGLAAASPPVANSASPASDNSPSGVVGSDTVGSLALTAGAADNTPAGPGNRTGGPRSEAAGTATGGAAATGNVPAGGSKPRQAGG